MRNIVKVKLKNIVILLVIIVTLITYFICNKSPNVLFISNVLLSLLIFCRAKFSIFSIKTLLVIYVLIAMAFQFNFESSYGILEFSIYKLNFGMANFLCFIYLLIIYIFIINSAILKQERDKQLEIHKISSISVLVCSIIAIVFSIIAFPRLIFGGARFESLLPGNAWNHIVVIALLLIYPNLKNSVIAKISYIFAIAWFLITGERVDMIGVIICLFIIVASNRFDGLNRTKLIQILKYIIIAICILFAMIAIGERRANRSISLKNIVKRVLVQNTAADLGYVYNISIEFPNDYGFLYGKTYKNYLDSIIPFNQEYSAAHLLKDTYYSPGGIFILSEPYMNFGIIGVIAFSLCEMYILHWIIKRKTKYSYYLYLFILATTFRTSWYGISYIEKGIIYILPLLFLIVNNIDKKSYFYKK